MSENDEMESEDYEGTIEQMIVENGLLLHAAVNILVRRGVIPREELDEELDRLYAQIDEGAEDDEGE